MTPEYSRFLIGMAMLAIMAIAVVGWLYVATEPKDEEELSEDDKVIKAMIDDYSDEEVDELLGRFSETFVDHLVETRRKRENATISGNLEGYGYIESIPMSVINQDAWSYDSCDSSAHSSHDCGSYDSGSYDSGFDGGCD
jgi:hypothetical protein